MNSEDKIYNKIKSASHKGEKDFPGMDKVWNRVEEKLDNTIVVKKKNTWQKLAIVATVLLSFSIIYHFVSNDEVIKDKIINNNTNPVIVSNDSVKKIIDKAKEVVVESRSPISNKLNPDFNHTKDNLYNKNNITDNTTDIERDSIVYETLPNGKVMARTYDYPNKIVTSVDNESLLRSNFSDSNSALNSSSSNNNYLVPNKKYEVTGKEVKSKYKAPKSKAAASPIQKNKDLVVIDGVAMDKSHNAEKELSKLDSDVIDTVYLPNPLYIINGVEYSEESLFGKNPTSPYAPLDKQKITSTNILQPADATKIYGKKGEKGIVIITTKDGKPAEK